VLERPHLLLPLASSIIYVLGALLVRRAADLGAGLWRTTFVANTLSAVLFLPLKLLGGPGQPMALWWQPALLAALLVLGQTLGFLALTRGDVTVATPVLGFKTILVAILTPLLLGLPLPSHLWWAASLSTAGIALLHLTGARHTRRLGISVTAASGAAVAFALFDVLIQRWSPAWGAGQLIPFVMGLGALFSLSFVPFFREPLWKIPPGSWMPLLGGSACISAQGILLITAVGVFGDATAINVVYAARSLWMVLAVWTIGHWFHNPEHQLGPRILGGRLAGATLMTTAIVLVLL